MESRCSVDQQQASVAYCACKFPLVALCQEHADKHLRESTGFHFPLPLSADQVITTRDIWWDYKFRLFRLSSNYEVIRDMPQLLANGEEQIESAYQSLLHSVDEAKRKIKADFSAKRDDFRNEIEKAIAETCNNPLGSLESVNVLVQMLWRKSPPELAQEKLFTFEAKCIQEHVPSVFRVALTFLPGMESLNLGESNAQPTDRILAKQLASQEEINILYQQVKDITAQRVEIERQLQEKTLQLQDAHRQHEDSVAGSQWLETENESLRKQCLGYEKQLNDCNQQLDNVQQSKAQLETQLSINQEIAKQQYQVLQMDRDTKAKRCAELEKDNTTLQKEKKRQRSQLKKVEAKLQCKKNRLANVKKSKSVLEARLKSWGITTDPPIEVQEPDHCTPESKAALDKYGPYDRKDDELILIKQGPVDDGKGVYIGQWNIKGQKHGYGKYLGKDGYVYEGQWRNDWMSGLGRYIWEDGDVYVGDHVQDKPEGFGTRYAANGDEYSGLWANGKMNGIGSKKLGEFSQFAGDRYIGEFLNDAFNGIGAYLWADGEMYVGSWKADIQHGKGLSGTTKGDMYFGDWVADARSGIGYRVYTNGDVYRGELKEDKPSGQGQLTHPGKVEAGIWVDGKFLS